MYYLAQAYQAAGRLADALSLYKESYERMRARMGEDHADTLNSMHNLAQAYEAGGHLADALPLYEKESSYRERLARATPPSQNTRTVRPLCCTSWLLSTIRQGHCCQAAERLEHAAQLLVGSCSRRRRVAGTTSFISSPPWAA